MKKKEDLLEEQRKNDINSKIFYKISFSIREVENNTDLLWELILHIKRWLVFKERKNGIIHVPRIMALWTRFKYGYKLYDTKNRRLFYAESLQRINPVDEKDISWNCRIRECENIKGFAPRWWTTEIGFQTMSNGAARLTFVVSYSDAMGFIGECIQAPDISVPAIVRNIQSDKKYTCEVNDEPLLFEAIELFTGQGMTLKELIYDTERGIPIILIMPKRDYIDKEKINLPIDPQKMIESVAGNALVYYSNELSFVDEMRYLMDADYRCTAGMIRYYLPEIDMSNPSDANRHRFIHYDDAIEMGEESILKIFRRVVAQDINDYDNLFRFHDCEELLRRDDLQTRFNNLKKKQEESARVASVIKDDMNRQLESMEIEKLEVEIENDDLKDEIENQRKVIYKMQASLDSMQAAFGPLQKGKEAYESVRYISEYPKTPQAILEFFTTVFSDRIDMTENGWKSLKDCNTDSAILWEVLYSMVNTLYECLGKYPQFSEACSQYNNQSSFECVPGNTSTTKKDKDTSREYDDIYMDKHICIEPHVKSNTGKPTDPRFFRIYFCHYLDDKSGKRKIVIGSCGGHLTTAGTMHRK